jgi:hypothetical protein
VSNEKKDRDGFDEEELIRSEFESIVSGLSLDESAPTTYLDDLDRIDRVLLHLHVMQLIAGCNVDTTMMMERRYE